VSLQESFCSHKKCAAQIGAMTNFSWQTASTNAE